MTTNHIWSVGLAISALFVALMLLFNLVNQDPQALSYVYQVIDAPIDVMEKTCGRGEAVQKCYGQNVCRVAKVKCLPGVECVEYRTICSDKRRFIDLLVLKKANQRKGKAVETVTGKAVVAATEVTTKT